MSPSMQKATGAPTVAEILTALRGLHRNYAHSNDAWAFFDELRLGTGFRRDSAQSVDAFAISLWPSKGWASYAYEIKVSRADFRKELREPLKRRAALRYSNMFWFVTQEGLVKPEEVPIECGLMEVRTMVPEPFWHAHVIVPAPWRDVPPPTWNLFASVARRVHRLENNGDRP